MTITPPVRSATVIASADLPLPVGPAMMASMFIATLIAGERLAAGDLSAAHDALAAAGCEPGGAEWIEAGRACDVPFGDAPAAAREALEGLIAATDVVVQPDAGRAKRLLVADMDSTMIAVECIDELADFAGVKPEVAAITERAMRGELDFAGALRARVALLAGLSVGTLGECYRERVTMAAGASVLVATMRAHGARALLVSGGFTAFADPVARRLGFDAAIANRLVVADGVLTGEVAPPIVDGAAKAAALAAERARLRLGADAVLAVGDGANDLAMIEAAGLGVAYRAKPMLAEAADARISHCDLTALLFAQGYRRTEWAVA